MDVLSQDPVVAVQWSGLVAACRNGERLSLSGNGHDCADKSVGPNSPAATGKPLGQRPAKSLKAGTWPKSGPTVAAAARSACRLPCSSREPGGDYDYDYNFGFVASQKNGVWGKAINVPGLRRVARDGYLNSVSCASAGNCAAGGEYGGAGSGVWVAREKNGVWGKQTTVPGLDALNKGSSVGVSSVSCPPAGSCVAGGYYQATGRYVLQGFVT
jgi:hypothetical protein